MILPTLASGVRICIPASALPSIVSSSATVFALTVPALPNMTCNFPSGLAVPIPTLFVEYSYTSPLVSTARPPAKVEVAEALLATKFAAVSCPVVASSWSLRKKVSGMKFAPSVVVATTLPEASVARSEERSEVMAKFVEVALVVVARVNTPVDAVEAPIAVELIVPPEMVRSSEMYAWESVEEAETRPPTAWSGPVREPMYREVVVALVERRCGKVLVEVVVAVKGDATASPTTESLAYGEVVPIPSMPVDMSTPASEVEVAGRVPKIKLPMLRGLLEVAAGKKRSLCSPTLPRPVVRLPAVTEGPTKTFP